MNEDEAFIRAIVDSPGDDLPRLVYADWLDDRDDPRGTYLRAEYEAVETGDPFQLWKLWDLTVALDAVWVARVSRPPVGACIDRAIVSDRGPHLTTDDVASAGRALGVELPAVYQASLLNYNGGRFRISASEDIRFYPYIRRSKPGTFADLVSIYRQYRSDYLGRSFNPDNSPWHWNYLPVAALIDSSELCLGITADKRGRVYAVAHSTAYDPNNACELADTLANFLASMWYHPAPKQLKP